MSLRFALLGLLARESLTGYDLTKKFDSTIGFFWSAKHSQIYPELAALSKEGLVTFEVVAQTSKPNKKVYTITEPGREALASWIGEDIEKRSVKDPMLMRVWALGASPIDGLLPHLKECLADMDRRMVYLQVVQDEVESDGRALIAPDNTNLGMVLAMRCGLMQYKAYRDWLHDTVATLEQLEA